MNSWCWRSYIKYNNTNSSINSDDDQRSGQTGCSLSETGSLRSCCDIFKVGQSFTVTSLLPSTFYFLSYLSRLHQSPWESLENKNFNGERKDGTGCSSLFRRFLPKSGGSFAPILPLEKQWFIFLPDDTAVSEPAANQTARATPGWEIQGVEISRLIVINQIQRNVQTEVGLFSPGGPFSSFSTAFSHITWPSSRCHMN